MMKARNLRLDAGQKVTYHGAARLGRVGVAILAAAMAFSMLGCVGPRSTDTLIGGAVGAGGGALVGSAVGAPGTGAVLGGLLGAGGGYLIGNAQAEAWHRRYYAPYYYRPYY